MTRAKSSVVFLCLLLAVALCAVPGSYAKEAPGQAKVLKIGLIVSLTGPMAPGFKSMADAAKPAADVLNKRGGITVKGQKYMVEFVTEDDQSSPAGAVAAANKLGKVGDKVTVHVLGGDLQVEVGKTIFLSGAAEKVYEGTLFKEP